ncbi:M23 family metallopeptidase [Treponema sp. OMZ 840]|uniref:peptidoglycan DD-metalloendopeptidase family protein n=1 Tax=Treponema sp. OMZ 840 TaxID=244313 RepID=UPI003D8D9615
MEIISCFDLKQVYASCGTLTMEEMLSLQRPNRRFAEAAGKNIRSFFIHGIKYAENLACTLVKAKTVLLAGFLLLLASAAAVRFLNYIYSYAAPFRFDVSVQTDSTILGGKMRNFALNSGAEFDGEGNISLADGGEASALFKMPVTYREYTVRAGDSISSISKRFGLNNISTLIAVNGIDNVRLLRAGQKLRVPSIDGLLYTIRSGDSLDSIAKNYGASMEEILDVNELSSDVLYAGTNLFIPGARLSTSALKKALGELFGAPLAVRWRISSPYGWRADPFTGVRTFHTGIDLVVPHGTSIKAAMSGTIAASGYSNIYGNYVIINHGNGYQTLYAHMFTSSVKNGQYVEQGKHIGYVGNTGYSTGAHLHFSVYRDGKLINPSQVLKF